MITGRLYYLLESGDVVTETNGVGVVEAWWCHRPRGRCNTSSAVCPCRLLPDGHDPGDEDRT